MDENLDDDVRIATLTEARDTAHANIERLTQENLDAVNAHQTELDNYQTEVDTCVAEKVEMTH